MIYPKFWFNRGGVSDRDWVFSMMKFIPEDKKRDVAGSYENLYLKDNASGRKAANIYLHGEAKKYRGLQCY